jgi:hypothetical protein
MNADLVNSLAEAFKEYYSQYELEEVCNHHGVDLAYVDTAPDYLKLARSVFSDLTQPSHRQFLKAVLPDLQKRCRQRIGNSAWDENLYHQQMLPLFQQFQQMLVREPPKPVAGAREPSNYTFSDRTQLKVFLGRAQSDVFIVDPDISVTTLECLLNAKTTVRLLTAGGASAADPVFRKALKTLQSRGQRIEVRRHSDLHDRYVCFNHRCWALNMPLKDAGVAAISAIELIDLAAVVIEFVEGCWHTAKSDPS